MPNQATKIGGQGAGRCGLKALAGLALVALAGCFGPPTMHYDVQEYNKQVVSSEKEMLLFNIGELYYKQPPHFMMVSSISQSRTFTASAGFQWSQIWNSLFPATPNIQLGQFAKGSGTWQAGPFTAGTVESPTITFVPIQGQDFANRFESTLADKFAIFNEDLWDSRPRAELADLISLFAEDLDLYHGDQGKCRGGVYHNRRREPREDPSDPTTPADATDPTLPYAKPHYYGKAFWDCVEQIVNTRIHDYEQIEGSQPVPTTQGEDPKAADVVAAQQAGYRWTKQHQEYSLASPAKILGWFDYIPDFVSPDEPAKTPSPLPVFWTESNYDTYPGWQYLQYTLPKGYSWKAFPVKVDENGKKIDDVYVSHGVGKNASESDVVYALVPDGYELDRYDEGEHKGELKFDKGDKPVLREIKDKPESEYTKFSYSDDIIKTQWPFPYDEVYVELRQNKLDYKNPPDDKSNKLDHDLVKDSKAKELCAQGPPKEGDTSYPGLVCGFFKIGNLLQIMHRLADNACDSINPPGAEGMDVSQYSKAIDEYCSPSIFGIGIVVPSWADSYAPFTNPDGIKEFAWVPAHDPNSTDPDQHDLGERDRRAFLTLYKLYQMSLVDTSKLITGAPAITISK